MLLFNRGLQNKTNVDPRVGGRRLKVVELLTEKPISKVRALAINAIKAKAAGCVERQQLGFKAADSVLRNGGGMIAAMKAGKKAASCEE